jgi:hypothetical protein
MDMMFLGTGTYSIQNWKVPILRYAVSTVFNQIQRICGLQLCLSEE